MAITSKKKTTGICLALCALLAWGCTEKGGVEIGGSGAGQSCGQVSDCEAGYTCENDVCTAIPPIDTGPQRGDSCSGQADCGEELFCGPQGVCALWEGSAEGEPCGLSVDCRANLVCHGDRLVCVDPAGYSSGVADLGDSCTSFTDCRRPYLCAMADPTNARCEKMPFFPGPDCIRTEEEAGAFRVYYELPPESLTEGEPFEFYRLPFPNDIRIKDGRISLMGHPSPGEVVGIDVAGAYIETIEQETDGFALNGPIFFRLTDFPEVGSICLDPGSVYPQPPTPEDEFCSSGGEPTIFLVDLDSNEKVPIQLSLTRERGQYICQNSIGIAPLDGQPLKPSTTYLAVLTTGLRNAHGDPPIPDLDFVRVLEADDTLPPAVVSATQPLRDWLSFQGKDFDTIAAATVFTTGNPAAMGQKLYDAVQALPAPAFNQDAFSCDTPVAHPCHGLTLSGQIPERMCGAVPSVYEIHGTYDGPVFQEGTRPYLTEDLGGGLNIGDSGLPERYGTEAVCYALTIPRGSSMPAGGWPVLIYSHGTNGNYRSFVDKSILEDITRLGFAVIGIDNVMHGPRQDPSGDPASWIPAIWNLEDPGNLFFNVINPRAARDNTLQGAVDLFYLTRLLENGSPTVAGVDTQFDPNQIFFLGHSQGTTIVPPYLVHEQSLQAAVLSGAGAELVLSILYKTEPVNIAGVVGALFGDRGLTRIHPMMGLLAILFGPADSVVYAESFPQSLPLVMFSGIDDHYTPYPTQAALIRAMGIPLVRPVEMSIEGVPEVNPPVSAGVVQYTPSGDWDGHFVLFNEPDAADVLSDFLQNKEVVR